MSKQVRNIVVLSAVVVLLVGALLFVNYIVSKPDDSSSSSSSQSEAEKFVIINKELGDDETVTDLVDNIKISLDYEEDKSKDDDSDEAKDPVKTKEDFALVKDTAVGLYLEGFSDLPIDVSAVSALATALTSIESTKQYDYDKDNLSAFALDKPRATIEVSYSDKTSETFLLGGNSPLGDGCYIMKKNDTKIYLISSSLANTYIKNSNSYIGKNLISSPVITDTTDTSLSVVLRDMELKGTVRTDHNFAFRMRSVSEQTAYSLSEYLIITPLSQDIESSKIESISTGTLTLTASDIYIKHPTEEESEKAGFKTPYSEADFSLAIMKKTLDENNAITEISYSDIEAHNVRVGNKTEEGLYYVMVDEINAIFLVEASALPWLTTRRGDVASSLLFMYNIENVESIEYTEFGKSTKFELNHFPDATDNDEKLKIEVDGKSYPTKDFRNNVYSTIMSVKRYEDTLTVPDKTADIVIKINAKKSSESIEINLYKLDVNLYVCKKSDGDIFTIKSSDVDMMITNIANYLKG